VYAIELDQLVKDYGGFRALHGITANIPKGAIGLLGPNGAGKSTLIKALLGLVVPTSGSGRVLGVDIAKRPLALRQRVGYMPEVDCHIPGLTAAQFVAYAGELCGMPGQDARKRAHEVLDYVGIDEERYRPVDGYSAGMRQKVKLAQALVHDPELLLLDEPTNGLDPAGRDQMLELCKDLALNHSKGLIYSSHLLTDVEYVCEEVVILQGGALVRQGGIEALRKKDLGAWEIRFQPGQGDQDAFLAQLVTGSLEPTEVAVGHYRLASPDLTEAGAAAKVVLEAAQKHGLQVRALRPSRSTLEDVFMDAVEGEVEPVPELSGSQPAKGA
jgi:ABC-2 type transport system ATP-binding protein